MNDSDFGKSKHQKRKGCIRSNRLIIIKLSELVGGLLWQIKSMNYDDTIADLLISSQRNHQSYLANWKQIQKFGSTCWNILNYFLSNRRKLTFPYIQLFSFWWIIFSRKIRNKICAYLIGKWHFTRIFVKAILMFI